VNNINKKSRFNGFFYVCTILLALVLLLYVWRLDYILVASIDPVNSYQKTQ